MLTIATIAIGAVTFSCDGATGDDETIAQDLADTSAFDALTYYDDWDGDLSLPEAPRRPITRDEWQDLVARQRSDGLASLSQDDRSRLLSGAIKSYLLRVSGNRRTIDAAGGSATILERYSNVSGLYVHTAEFQHESRDIQALWGDVLIASPGTYEAAYVVSYSSEAPRVRGWETDEKGSRICANEGSDDDPSFGLGIASKVYVGLLESIASEEWTVSRKTVGGRGVEELLQPFEAGLRTVWLDAESLFPIRTQTPEIRDSRGEQFMPARDVRIVAFNPPERVTVTGQECDE